MKKLLLFVGLAVGFVLGSKQGRGPYVRLEAQFRQLAGRPEVKGAVNAVSDKAADLADTAVTAVREKADQVTVGGKHAPRSADTKPHSPRVPDVPKGPTGSIDQSEIDAETEAALDKELEGTFPTSDPPSSWAGPDIEPERPEDTAAR